MARDYVYLKKVDACFLRTKICTRVFKCVYYWSYINVDLYIIVYINLKNKMEYKYYT